jgi:ATP/maltotriose-dependent transcriptional regulator MalT
VLYHRGLALCEEGKLDAAVEQTNAAIATWPPVSFAGYGFLHHTLLTYYYWSGTLNELERTAQQLRARFRPEQFPAWRATLRYYMAIVHIEQGAFDAAEHLLLQVIDPSAAGMLGTRSRAILKLAELAAYTGRREALAAAVEPLALGARAIYHEEQPLVLKAAAAMVALALGDDVAALRWARAETGVVRAATLALGQVPLARAEILLAGDRQDLGTAITLLKSHLAGAISLRLAGGAMQTAILLALACRRLGQGAAALHALETAVALGCNLGYRWSFYRHGEAMREMLHALRGSAQTSAAVATLLGAFPHPAAPSVPPMPAAAPRGGASKFIDGFEPLTVREHQVLQLLAQNLTNKEIGRALHVSTFTVRNHTVNIYQKLAVASRREAITRAAALGLLPPVGSTLT